MVKEKFPSVPFYGLELTFVGTSSFKVATPNILFGDKSPYRQTTWMLFCVIRTHCLGTFSLYSHSQLSCEQLHIHLQHHIFFTKMFFGIKNFFGIKIGYPGIRSQLGILFYHLTRKKVTLNFISVRDGPQKGQKEGRDEGKF